MNLILYIAALVLLINHVTSQNMNMPNQQGSNTFNNQPQPGMPGSNTFNNQPQPGTNTFNNQPQSGTNTFNNQQQQALPGTNQQPPMTNQNMPPMSPEERSQMTCAQAGRTAVSQCFQSNGNFQMMTVIALLSNGTQGQLPANPEQVRANLCSVQSQIFSCIFTNIQRYNGSQECSTPASYLRLEQETVGLLSGVQQMCGTGIMPTVTPCVQRVNFDLMQCFEEVGLNPELYSPRASRMEGAIIGDNREVARGFCGKRKDLFACQRTVMEQCPEARAFQAISGTDQFAQHNGMEVLCNDIEVYVKGLVCFQSPTSQVETCANKLVQDMTDVTFKQLRDNLSTDAFFSEYCKTRLENLQCDVAAWNSACDPAAVGLKAEYQCNLLPEQCRNSSLVGDAYGRACAVPTFNRQLRGNAGTNDKNGSAGIVALATTVLSVASFVLVLIL